MRYPGTDGRTNAKKPDSKYKKSYHHIMPVTQHTKDSSHTYKYQTQQFPPFPFGRHDSIHGVKSGPCTLGHIVA